MRLLLNHLLLLNDTIHLQPLILYTGFEHYVENIKKVSSRSGQQLPCATPGNVFIDDCLVDSIFHIDFSLERIEGKLQVVYVDLFNPKEGTVIVSAEDEKDAPKRTIKN